MAGILSKLKKTPGKTAVKSRPTKIVFPQSYKRPDPSKKPKQTPWYATVSKTSWLFFGLFVCFLIAIMATLVFSIHQTKHDAAYQEITGRLQMHSQRIAKASQQTILGHTSAFAQLQESRHQLDTHLTLLIQGGVYRGMNIAAIHKGPAASSLNTFREQWLSEDKKINLIMRSRDVLVRLGGNVSEINTVNAQLLSFIDQLGTRIEQTGHFPNEVIVTEAMKVLARSITKSINTVLPSEYPISEISTQLTKDRERLSILITALNQGNNGLRVTAIKDAEALKMLQQIQALYRVIDDHANNFQQEISGIITIKFAVQKLLHDSETILIKATALENAIEERNAAAERQLNWVVYALGALAILALFLFAKSFTSNMHQKLLDSKKEVEATEQAILRLLDDMEKIANGNLTVRTKVAENMTGAIADAINYTIEELHSLVAGVNRATTQVVEASNQAQKMSSKLLAATQKQSEDIEDTTMAVLGIAESISDVSKTTAETAKVAKQSLTAAEKGTIAVRDSITGMNEIRSTIQETSKRIKRLGESSQEIGEIVALISDITEQTNILALNAAIQAASAGEAGRGFTIIANEVQRLAERSAEATKQIDALVKTIQGDTQDTIVAMEKSTSGVAEGTKRSDIAGDALEEIEKVSKHLEKLVADISDNTDTQAREADRVVRNMEAILEVTRQTTHGTTKTTESMKQMTNSASELKASVSNFKV